MGVAGGALSLFDMLFLFFILLSQAAWGTVDLGTDRDIFQDVLQHAGSVVSGVVDTFNKLTGFTAENEVFGTSDQEDIGFDWIALFKGAYSSILWNQKFIRNDWRSLQKEVQFRYFSFENYTSSDDLSAVWAMGQDITCTLYQYKVVCSIPEKKRTMKPLKIFTHGFDETMTGQKIVFLKAWMKAYKGSYDVILLDWKNLALLTGVDTQEEGVPVACSHSRVLKYFLHSILQRQLFPVVDCPSMKHCSSKALITGVQAEKIFMGEAAAEGFDGSVRMFFTNIEDCHWDYIEHNNYHIVNICVGRDAEQVNMGDPRR